MSRPIPEPQSESLNEMERRLRARLTQLAYMVYAKEVANIVELFSTSDVGVED